MANKDSILYLPRNIELIPNTVLTKGLVWLKPNIIKPIKSQLKSDLDIIWYDKEQYFAQSISFKETEKIANQNSENFKLKEVLPKPTPVKKQGSCSCC